MSTCDDVTVIKLGLVLTSRISFTALVSGLIHLRSTFAGAMFDKNGNLANWWSKESLVNFIKREKCFVDEYSKFKVQGHPVRILTIIVTVVVLNSF